MKNLILICSILFSSLSAVGATLNDVEVLEVTTTEAGEELKLRDRKLTPKGHFYVILVKKDQDALKKSGLIMKKLLEKENFKLILEVDSFSASPSGSSYQSTYVEFKGK